MTNFPRSLRSLPRATKFYDALADGARFVRAASEIALGGLHELKENFIMTDIDETATYQRRQEALRDGAQFNKGAVFDALSAAGITSVRVEFDGEGDSGQINSIAAYVDGNSHEIPSVTVEILSVSWGKAKLDSKKTTLHDAIETVCYDALSEEHDGWENNDGAFGEFTFDVEKRSIGLEFNARFSDFVTSNHTF
jgi:uncharacterized protein DUF6878